jgi:integrase
MRVYDCRHACATTWLREGVPLGEAARRLGHSVETLVSVYVGALDGDDVEANRRLTPAFGPTWGWLGEVDEPAEKQKPTRRGSRRRSA